MYLTALTFIEDGNKDKHQNGLINFSKRRLLAAVIRDIQMYQQDPYNLAEVPELKNRLRAVNPRDVNTLYTISQQREPPEKRPGSARPFRQAASSPAIASQKKTDQSTPTTPSNSTK